MTSLWHNRCRRGPSTPSLLACSALVVESNDALGWAAHVGDYKADTRIEFARMPFDLGDDAAGFCPTPGLIGEVRIGAPHFVRRPPNRARQQMADPFLQDAVRWQPYCVFDPLGFEKLINFGIGDTFCPKSSQPALTSIFSSLCST